MVKDRQIGFIQLHGEVRGRYSMKHLYSADEKSQHCLEIGGRVGANWWNWILFKRLSIRFRIDHMQVN